MTTANLACATVTPTSGATNGVQRLTIGIDLGDKHSHLCVLDGEGSALRHRTGLAEFGRRAQRDGEAAARVRAMR